MNLTHCPVCNTRVHSTHRCHGRAADLVPMPTDFRSRIDQARTEQHDAEQLDLLVEVDR